MSSEEFLATIVYNENKHCCKEPIVVKLKKLHELASLPQQATEFAGGWDVVVTKIEQVSDDFVICYLGFSTEFPKGYKLTLVPRSSLTKTKWLLQNSPCCGDADYRGQYSLRFRALPHGFKTVEFAGGKGSITGFSYPQFPYKVGERIGQVYLEKVLPTEFKFVDELSNTERGEGGFGSTGL